MSSTGIDPTQLGAEEVREAVREHYAAAAREARQNIEIAGSGCGCSITPATGSDPIIRELYGEEAAQTSAAALAASFGCGNPTLLADLRPGETVLDLGSGGGLDVLLSARRVGPTGKAYGLDMTPDMLELARRNQAEAGIENAEFLQGTIESIPLPDESVDVIISNCVINLAPDKDPVLREAFRVLKPGGRFAVADIVLLRPLPEFAQRVMTLWSGCTAGALVDSDYIAKLEAAGFVDAGVEVTRRYDSQDVLDMAEQLPASEIPAGVSLTELAEALDGATAGAFVRATKPAAA